MPHPLIKPLLTALCTALLLIAVAFRFATISADTPSGLSWSAGLYVDEGYKTLAPRNMLLYGKPKWHDADTYSGWIDSSPLTQWPIYASFKVFGANVESARIVAIGFFILFIFLYIFLFAKKFNPPVFALGLLLLTTDSTIFIFSRTMLLEMAMMFFLYAAILIITLHYKHKTPTLAPTILLLIFSFVIAKTVKHSAILYFLPAILASCAYFIFNNEKITKKQAITILLATGAITLLILATTSHVWLPRIGQDPLIYFYKIIYNPLLKTSPILVVTTSIIIAVVLLKHHRYYLQNLYRLTLVSMVLVTPLLLSVFEYGPMRYYSPIVPAYILLLMEWASTKGETANEPHRALIIIAILTLTIALTQILVIAGLHENIRMAILVGISAIVAFSAVQLRHYLLTRRFIKPALFFIIAGTLAYNLFFMYNFYKNQTFTAQHLRERLTTIINKSEIVAGGWAPFFTLGTGIKSLYANTTFNTPDALKIIKPDYFMLSETPTARKTFALLQDDKEITPASPVFLGIYNNTKIYLYPLTYAEARN